MRHTVRVLGGMLTNRVQQLIIQQLTFLQVPRAALDSETSSDLYPQHWPFLVYLYLAILDWHLCFS